MFEKDNKIKKFWRWINHIHLYTTKAETVFKAVIITISWIGGVHLLDQTNTHSIGSAFYLFSISLIMEYMVGLIVAKKFIARILPFLICILSVIVFFGATAILLNKPFESIKYEHFKTLTNIPLYIIWFDSAIMLLINPTKNENIENNLSEL